MSIAINCSFTIYFACYCVMIEGFTLLYVLGLLEAFIFCGLGWILTCTSVILNRSSIDVRLIVINFSFFMLAWILLQTKCSTTNVILTFVTNAVATTTDSLEASSWISLSLFACAHLWMTICCLTSNFESRFRLWNLLDQHSAPPNSKSLSSKLAARVSRHPTI